MSTHNVSLFAVRALILVRNSETKSLTGNVIISQLRQLSGDTGQATGMLSFGASPIETIQTALDLLVEAGLLHATHTSTGSNPVTLDSYRSLRNKGAIQAIKFSLTDNVRVIQETLGFRSLSELEQRAMGNTISIQPLFGQVQTGLFKKKTVFVAMPFDEKLYPVYQMCIAPSVQEVGLKATRADDIFSGSSIMNKVWNAIYGSYAVIADCSGRNANVFYELGMAHTIGKTCLILTQSKDDIPFDITQFEYIAYENTTRGLAELKNQLTVKLKELVREAPPY